MQLIVRNCRTLAAYGTGLAEEQGPDGHKLLILNLRTTGRLNQDSRSPRTLQIIRKYNKIQKVNFRVDMTND